MKTLIKIMLLLSFVAFLNSCGFKTYSFLKACRAKNMSEGTKYYLTSSKELKENLPKGVALFYSGSDTSFHYLIYFYDKLMKTTMIFILPLEQYTPVQTIQYSDTSKVSFQQPVYTSDLIIKNE